MPQGIAILGLNGCGKSTLAHALAKATGWHEIDAEDYYFPQQRASRVWALDHEEPYPLQADDVLPFSQGCTKQEAQAAILAEIVAHPRFILTGVTMNWDKATLSRIGVAVLLKVPPEERQRRLLQREVRRFGNRVLPGGDMCAQQEAFRHAAALRSPQDAADSAYALGCPVVTLDGTLPVAQNVSVIAQLMKKL